MIFNRDALGRDLRTTVVAVVAASVVAGPSAAVAAYVANADKVDNKHAVGAGASVKARKGKLVATDPTTGFLPGNIIAKARDSETLDGLDSTAFLGAGAKASDAEQLDGRDASSLVPRQASAEFGYGVPDQMPTALTGSPRDVAHVVITVPGPGRIQVDGRSVVMAEPSQVAYSFASFSISTTPDAHNPSDAGVALWDMPAIDGAMDGLFRTTIPTTRTFEVAGAGTYTYYVVGEGSAVDADSPDGPLHYSSQVTAQYFPAP